MSRWRRVVRRELARYENQTDYDVFELGELYEELTPVLRSEFPDNDHPRAKLRQVLQQLRDREEVAFLGDGTYRILSLGDAASERETSGSGSDWTTTEYETTTTGRSTPRAFRAAVLAQYGGRCPVSAVDHERLLDVAHVLDWSDHPDRRTDLGNVLPLSKTHHAAFDAGLFTLDEAFRLRVSPSFETACDPLRRTLHDRAGQRLDDLADAPLSGEYLARHNRTLDWR